MQTPELDTLYREVVLDHYRNPRGREPVPSPTVESEGKNPLCGDETKIRVELKDGRIARIQAQGMGCSISVASASMMSELLEGKTLEEARRVMRAFEGLMRGEEVPQDLDLGDLEALDGVKRFPVRIKCVLLAWKTLEEALRDVPEAGQEAGPSGEPGGSRA
ncbi:MAG: SUF system NifU family Fe-S cluster assembly protein [Candidatus Eisenbacteria bacterium]|nr:SUF system NifU family Fe-S cluster assembly protein [Candidatus Eisenbacteria bacterium]